MSMLRRLNRKIVFRLFIFALIVSLGLEIGMFMRDKALDAEGNLTSVLEKYADKVDFNGYRRAADAFVSMTNDPQIFFYDVEETVDAVVISFNKRVFANLDIQVYYSADGSGLSEAASVHRKWELFPTGTVIIDIPKSNVDMLRVDINGSFELDDILVCDGNIRSRIVFANPFNCLRTAAVLVSVFIFAACFFLWYHSEKNERSLTKMEAVFCVICFLYYFAWAIPKDNLYPPDEVCRHDVTEFLLARHRLPVGDELLEGQIRNGWGFSYAHRPGVLCNWLGYGFSLIASLISKNEGFLLRAARMASVCCGAGAVYFLMKSAKMICNPFGKWTMVMLVAAMPQYAFLSGYVNNDIVAFFGVTILLYSWILSIKDDWNLKNAALLAIGISVCALSYYNSYSWILFSVFFFYITYFYKNKKNYKGAWKLTVYIAVIVFLLIGYSFIRHLIIYGDLLGFRTTEYYGELYAEEHLKPSNRDTFFRRGVPLSQMLFERGYGWCKMTWLSVIGIFRYMDIFCPSIIYILVSAIILLGGIGAAMRVVSSFFMKRKIDIHQIVFYGCAVLSALVTIGLSIHYSYFTDYQPQGRYCYPAFLTLAVIVGKGYEYLLQRFLKTNEQRYAACASVCTIMVVISVFAFHSVYLPS